MNLIPVPKSKLLRKHTCLLPDVIPKKPKHILVPKANIRQTNKCKAAGSKYQAPTMPKKLPVPKNDANVDNIGSDWNSMVQIGTQEYTLADIKAKLQQMLASDGESTDSDGIDSDDI